jgi:hypothetical protein
MVLVLSERNFAQIAVRTRGINTMARGACTFRQQDVTRALKAASAAGVQPSRLEIDTLARKIVVFLGEQKTTDAGGTSNVSDAVKSDREIVL